ncbi:hypothetical protein [Bifidobacterium panos]|uniref:Antitoxin n=1 Tax=Bifidobacterium panos TaxID=2675321 RepID=A0ABX1SXP2_9BIFI|nr:hypothetical protein [Bifidobacterium sp. DSM 109963]NMN02616.1 hypothetical protein [Bifidobacterium sp. DSM 109963]
MSSAQQVTVSFDYDAHARASEEMGFTSDEVMKGETVMRSPEDVRAHFNGLMRKALQDV